MRHAIVIALAAGLLTAFWFVALVFVSLFMVFGDGTAPAFTYVMGYLVELPYQLVGVRVDAAMLFKAIFIAAAFWGAVTGTLTFVGLCIFGLWMRESSGISWPRRIGRG